MTREVVETAIREGIPFQIKMADGRSYIVRDELSVALGKTTVVVLEGEGDRGHWLPLLTMTGISYLDSQAPNGNSET